MLYIYALNYPKMIPNHFHFKCLTIALFLTKMVIFFVVIHIMPEMLLTELVLNPGQTIMSFSAKFKQYKNL